MKPRARKPSVFAFFFCTFCFSWLIWVPLTLSHLQIGPFHISVTTSNGVRLLGVFGPAIVAISLSAVIGGRRAVADVTQRLNGRRISGLWWAAATLIQPAILLLTFLLYNALAGSSRLTVLDLGSASGFIVQIVILALAAFGEEIGWRGFALPTLLRRFSALTASLILAVFWTLWHIPFWVLQTSFQDYGPSYWVLNFLSILPTTIFLTWIFNHTRGSILPAVAFHLTFNIINVAVVQVTGLIVPYLILIVLQWIVALALLIAYGPKTLTRPGEVNPLSVQVLRT
jgi:membrane protease YdiL (CAAX protease family)